jgi:hypothetical protein
MPAAPIIAAPTEACSGPAKDDLVAAIRYAAWAELQATLVVRASFSHHAQDGWIWPDGTGMPDRATGGCGYALLANSSWRLSRHL